MYQNLRQRDKNPTAVSGLIHRVHGCQLTRERGTQAAGLMSWQATDLGEPAIILGALEKRQTKKMKRWKEARQQMVREKTSGSVLAMKGPEYKMLQKSLEAKGTKEAISFALPRKAMTKTQNHLGWTSNLQIRNECHKPRVNTVMSHGRGAGSTNLTSILGETWVDRQVDRQLVTPLAA